MLIQIADHDDAAARTQGQLPFQLEVAATKDAQSGLGPETLEQIKRQEKDAKQQEQGTSHLEQLRKVTALGHGGIIQAASPARWGL